MGTTLASSLMTVATSAIGILSLVGMLSAIGLIAFMPTLKRSKSALNTVGFLFLAVALLVYILTIASSHFGGWYGFDTQPATKATSQLNAGNPTQRPNEAKPPAAETTVSTVGHISLTQAVHDSAFKPTKRDYVRIFEADPGYRISEAKIPLINGNNVSDVRVHVVPDGMEAVVYFSLTSGPQFNRYKAWIDTDIHITQNKVASSSDIPASAARPGRQ